MEEKKILYSNDTISVIWKPELCIHSGVCVNTLPEVYRPKEKEWVKVNNATTKELVEQIKKCPSGALSYLLKNSL